MQIAFGRVRRKTSPAKGTGLKRGSVVDTLEVLQYTNSDDHTLNWERDIFHGNAQMGDTRLWRCR